MTLLFFERLLCYSDEPSICAHSVWCPSVRDYQGLPEMSVGEVFLILQSSAFLYTFSVFLKHVVKYMLQMFLGHETDKRAQRSSLTEED